MNKENGFTYQILILIIVLVIAITGVIINKLIGKNGIVDQVVEVENDFKKEDVLEKINYLVTQKFIELNNEAKQNNKTISEVYNADIVISFLKENKIISEIYDEEENIQDGIYLINIENLKKDDKNIDSLKIEGKFQLEKSEEKYYVVYYDKNDNNQNLGELQIQQT